MKCKARPWRRVLRSKASFRAARTRWAVSSAVEHYLDMVGVTGSNPVPPTTWLPALPVQRWIRMKAGPGPAFRLRQWAAASGQRWATHSSMLIMRCSRQCPSTRSQTCATRAEPVRCCGCPPAGAGCPRAARDLAQPVKLKGGRVCFLIRHWRCSCLPSLGLQDLAAQGSIPGVGIAAEQASAQQQQGKHRHGTVLRRRESSVALPLRCETGMRRKPVKRAPRRPGKDESGAGSAGPPQETARRDAQCGWAPINTAALGQRWRPAAASITADHSTAPAGLPELPNGQLGCGSQPGA